MSEFTAAINRLADSNTGLAHSIRKQSTKAWVIISLLVVCIVLLAVGVTGVVLIRNTQSTNGNILQLVENVTNPNSPYSQAAKAQLGTEILGFETFITNCVENHSDRLHAETVHAPIPALLKNCPGG